MKKPDYIAQEFTIKKLNADTPFEAFEKLAELDKLCFSAESWSAEAFRDEAAADNGIVLCALDGERVAGLICGYFAADQADIASVVTHPDYRRQGLADRMLNEFEAQLPNITESIFLDVRESNTAAIALYEKNGFVRLSIRKNYYQEPSENAIIMQKILNKEG